MERLTILQTRLAPLLASTTARFSSCLESCKRWPIAPVTISFAAALIGRERLSIAARGRAAQQG
jgi:hypothetical protein